MSRQGLSGAADAQNISYFISDGTPQAGSGQSSGSVTLTAGEAASIGWTALQGTGAGGIGLESYAIGISTSPSDSDLQVIAPASGHVIQVGDDFSSLPDALAGTVHAPAIEGDLAFDIGADQAGAHIASFTINGDTYEYNEATHQFRVNGGPLQSATQDGQSYKITAEGAHGSFSFTVEGPGLGHYSYVPESVSAGTAPEDSVTYTLVDGDGDGVQSSISFDITASLSVTPAAATVSEDGLPGANDNTGVDDDASVSLGISADGVELTDVVFASGTAGSLNGLEPGVGRPAHHLDGERRRPHADRLGWRP